MNSIGKIFKETLLKELEKVENKRLLLVIAAMILNFILLILAKHPFYVKFATFLYKRL